MKLNIHIFLFCALSGLWACRPPDQRISGTYKTHRGDTLKLIEDHSFRIELAEPDTMQQQFKISTGRWSLHKRKVKLNMDSRSMGQYWECQPLKKGWNRLRRPEQCEGKSRSLVFEKVRQKKIRQNEDADEYGNQKVKKKKKKSDTQEE